MASWTPHVIPSWAKGIAVPSFIPEKKDTPSTKSCQRKHIILIPLLSGPETPRPLPEGLRTGEENGNKYRSFFFFALSEGIPGTNDPGDMMRSAIETGKNTCPGYARKVRGRKKGASLADRPRATLSEKNPDQREKRVKCFSFMTIRETVNSFPSIKIPEKQSNSIFFLFSL